MGTVNYMSPEQARGQKVDHRTDIFSLGVMLYEMVAGRRPFDGETAIDAIAAILRSDPPPVNQLRPGLPTEMERIIGQMLVKDRESRYGSAAELRAELQRLQRKMEAAAPETTSAGEAPAAESAAPALTTFVGREAEMERLDRLLRQAVAGASCVVFITGEPGIGKTSLADRFLRDARRSHPSLICGRGQCVEQYGAGEAYLPFLDALGGLLAGPQRERIMGVLRTYAPTWCLQFPAVFSGDAGAVAARNHRRHQRTMLREMGEALGPGAGLAGGAFAGRPPLGRHFQRRSIAPPFAARRGTAVARHRTFGRRPGSQSSSAQVIQTGDAVAPSVRGDRARDAQTGKPGKLPRRAFCSERFRSRSCAVDRAQDRRASAFRHWAGSTACRSRRHCPGRRAVDSHASARGDGLEAPESARPDPQED